MKKKLVFVGGLPRAGSSLLMNLLGQNPQFQVTPTSPVIDMLNSMRVWFTKSEGVNAQDEEEMAERFKCALYGALMGWVIGVKGNPVYVDKSRGWIQYYEFLEDLLEYKPKVIVPIRDLRGVLMSMERLFRSNHLRIDPIQQGETLASLTTEGRVKLWAAGIPVGVAADRIKDTVTRGVDKDMFFLRYEDLTNDTQRQMTLLYRYLEEDFFSHDFSDIKRITKEDDRVYGISNLHTVDKEIRPARENWDDFIGKALAEDIKKGSAWFYERFYPER